MRRTLCVTKPLFVYLHTGTGIVVRKKQRWFLAGHDRLQKMSKKIAIHRLRQKAAEKKPKGPTVYLPRLFCETEWYETTSKKRRFLTRQKGLLLKVSPYITCFYHGIFRLCTTTKSLLFFVCLFACRHRHLRAQKTTMVVPRRPRSSAKNAKRHCLQMILRNRNREKTKRARRAFASVVLRN